MELYLVSKPGGNFYENQNSIVGIAKSVTGLIGDALAAVRSIFLK